MTDQPLPAPSSITFQSSGNSLQQLFETIAQELLKIMIDPEEVGETLREKIIVEAPDAAGLLQGWVDGILRLAADQNILYKKSRFQEFEVERVGPGRLRAEITGEFVDPLRHSFRLAPSQLRCERVALLNNSKTIEAQIFLASAKISLAK